MCDKWTAEEFVLRRIAVPYFVEDLCILKGSLKLINIYKPLILGMSILFDAKFKVEDVHLIEAIGKSFRLHEKLFLVLKLCRAA